MPRMNSLRDSDYDSSSSGYKIAKIKTIKSDGESSLEQFDRQNARRLKKLNKIMKNNQENNENQENDDTVVEEEKIKSSDEKDVYQKNKVSFKYSSSVNRKNSVSREISPLPSFGQVLKTDHIMISYNKESRELCMQIKAVLEKEGHKIWIDVEDIHGSSLESMANAIENSKCVLICKLILNNPCRYGLFLLILS